MKNIRKYIVIIFLTLLLTACSSGSEDYVYDENLSEEENQANFEAKVKEESVVETKIEAKVSISEPIDNIASIRDRMLLGLPEAITQHRDKMIEAFALVQEVRGIDDYDFQDAGYEKYPTVKGETFVFYPQYNPFGNYVDIYIRMFTNLDGNLVPVVTPRHTPFIENMEEVEFYMPELVQ